MQGLHKLNARGDKLIAVLWQIDCEVITTQYGLANLAQRWQVGIGPCNPTIKIKLARLLYVAPFISIGSPRYMSLEPFQTVFANRPAIRKQKKRTDMIVALKVEMWDTVDATTEIDVERNPETLHTCHRLGGHRVPM